MIGGFETSASRRRVAPSPWAKKRRRLVFVLGALVLPLVPVLWWRVALARDVRQSIAALEARGLPVRFAQLNTRQSLTPSENAAERYFEAAQAYQDVAAAIRAQLPFVGQPLVEPGVPLAPETRDALQAFVDANAPTLNLLREATAVPDARYVLEYGTVADVSHLEKLRPLAALLCCQALASLENNAPSQADQSLRSALALSQSLANDGYLASLSCAWEMERQVLSVLERLLHTGELGAGSLAPYSTRFAPTSRLAQIQAVLEVEQGVFIARIREGRQRGVFKQIIVSAGVGDLNLQAYLEASALVQQWINADWASRDGIEAEYGRLSARWNEHPLLYVTLQRFSPPCDWKRFRRTLDEAVVVEVALAAYDYRLENGRYPSFAGDMEPRFLRESAPLSNRPEGAVLEHLAGGARVHNGALGDNEIDFRLPALD